MYAFHLAAGIVAGLANLAGFIPYIRDIFRHKTKPERAMWWIYSMLFMVLWAAQLGAGATWLLISTATYVITALWLWQFSRSRHYFANRGCARVAAMAHHE
jgi:hypothetical protein